MKKLKKQNGFTGADVLIAIAIITLFTGLVTSIAYNIYLATSSTQRMSQANAYISDVFAQVDKLYYDDVTTNGLTTYFSGKSKTGYTVTITVEKYSDIDPSKYPLDLIKKVTMDVNYKVGNKDQKLEMTRIKQREVLITPNAPDLTELPNNPNNSYNSSNVKAILPIKYSNGNWVVCDTKDSNWYNYDNGYWAVVLVIPLEYTGTIPVVGQIITSEDRSNMSGETYTWIPRYACYGYYNGSEYVMDACFLYGTSDKCVEYFTDGKTRLIDKPSNYEIHGGFNGPKAGIWERGKGYGTPESLDLGYSKQYKNIYISGDFPWI